MGPGSTPQLSPAWCPPQAVATLRTFPDRPQPALGSAPALHTVIPEVGRGVVNGMARIHLKTSMSRDAHDIEHELGHPLHALPFFCLCPSSILAGDPKETAVATS